MEQRLLCTLLVACLPMSACGPKNFLNENDELRRKNMELRKQVDALEEKAARRAGQIASLEADLARQRGGDPEQVPGVPGAPVLSGVLIDRYSGPLDLNQDGFDEVLRVYAYPVDQKGRFLSTSGALSARVAHVPTEGEPVVLTERHLDTAAFDASYRAGFTGPYYRVDIPLPQTLPPEVVLRITLTESRSGVVFSDQKTYRVTAAQQPGP